MPRFMVKICDGPLFHGSLLSRVQLTEEAEDGNDQNEH